MLSFKTDAIQVISPPKQKNMNICILINYKANNQITLDAEASAPRCSVK